MGHTAAIKFGERSKKTGKIIKKNRIWVAPCHDWSQEEQRSFLQAHRFPENEVKESLLGMSGECFCGAFARPYELEMVREICPDVANEIDRLTSLAKQCGISQNNCTWGFRDRKSKIEVQPTGELCNTCDLRAAAAGIVISPRKLIPKRRANHEPDSKS